MSNDLRVVPISSKSGSCVVETLEAALALAKEGKVANCMVVLGMNKGPEIMNGWANFSRGDAMVGGLKTTSREFTDAVIQSRGD